MHPLLYHYPRNQVSLWTHNRPGNHNDKTSRSRDPYVSNGVSLVQKPRQKPRQTRPVFTTSPPKRHTPSLRRRTFIIKTKKDTEGKNRRRKWRTIRTYTSLEVIFYSNTLLSSSTNNSILLVYPIFSRVVSVTNLL